MKQKLEDRLAQKDELLQKKNEKEIELANEINQRIIEIKQKEDKIQEMNMDIY